MDRVSNVLRDLNGWVGDKVRVGINGAVGVSGENENGWFLCRKVCG